MHIWNPIFIINCLTGQIMLNTWVVMIFCKNLLSLIIQASSTPMRRFASAFNIYFYLPIKKKLCMHTLFFFLLETTQRYIDRKKVHKEGWEILPPKKTELQEYAHTFSMWLCMNAIHFISFMYKVFYWLHNIIYSQVKVMSCIYEIPFLLLIVWLGKSHWTHELSWFSVRIYYL